MENNKSPHLTLYHSNSALHSPSVPANQSFWQLKLTLTTASDPPKPSRVLSNLGDLSN
jgi:hypothetical protein